MRQASPTGRDLGVKCSAATVGCKHSGREGRTQGCCGTDKEINFPHSYFRSSENSPLSFDKLSMSSIYGQLKFATILGHIFLLFICSNIY